MSNVIIDITKSLYCIDKQTKETHKVSAVYFPIDSLSGKHLTIEIGEDTEWRSMDDVIIINNME